MTKTMFSGGAKGADTYWSQKAEAAGYDVINYSFKGHGCTNIGQIVRLSDDQLREADPFIEAVNAKYLHRGNFKNYSPFVQNLIRRNYWQIRDSQGVYAIADFDNSIVQGGTAWAVYMAIENQIEVSVFEQKIRMWMIFGPKTGHISGWEPSNLPGEFPEKWTGIGTRNLLPEGRMAIDSIF